MFDSPRQFVFFAIALLVGWGLATFAANRLVPRRPDERPASGIWRVLIKFIVVVAIGLVFGVLKPQTW